jgi:peptidoglycan/LPS O-acetylase OafA/YrhL
VNALIGTHLVPLAVIAATAVGAVITYHVIEVPLMRIGSVLARLVESRKPARTLQVPPSA